MWKKCEIIVGYEVIHFVIIVCFRQNYQGVVLVCFSNYRRGRS